MTEPVVPTGTPPATPPQPPAAPPATPPAPPAPTKEPEPELMTVEEKKADEYVMPENIDLLDPKQAREAIEKTVESRLKKVQGDLQEQRIDQEVKSYIESNPEYKPYADKISKWVKHPNRINFIKNGLPVSSVILEAVAPHLQEIGAEKARIADAKAKASGGGGTGAAPKTPGKVDYKSMSLKDIEVLAEKVKAGQA